MSKNMSEKPARKMNVMKTFESTTREPAQTVMVQPRVLTLASLSVLYGSSLAAFALKLLIAKIAEVAQR
jgi:hypothetical protein